jgi:hypothetical protein
MLSVGAELPLVANVRSSDGTARTVNMGPQQLFARSYLELLRIFLYVGVFSAVYWLLRLLKL